MPSKAGPHYGMVIIQVSCYVYVYGCEETIELLSGIGIFGTEKRRKTNQKTLGSNILELISCNNSFLIYFKITKIKRVRTNQRLCIIMRRMNPKRPMDPTIR